MGLLKAALPDLAEKAERFTVLVGVLGVVHTLIAFGPDDRIELAVSASGHNTGELTPPRIAAFATFSQPVYTSCSR